MHTPFPCGVVVVVVLLWCAEEGMFGVGGVAALCFLCFCVFTGYEELRKQKQSREKG